MEESLTKETLLIAGVDFGDVEFGMTTMANIILTGCCAIIAMKFLIHEL